MAKPRLQAEDYGYPVQPCNVRVFDATSGTCEYYYSTKPSAAQNEIGGMTRKAMNEYYAALRATNRKTS